MEEKKHQSKIKLYGHVVVMKRNCWIHGQPSIHLRPVTFLRKCHFYSQTLSDFEYFCGDLHPMAGKNCQNKFFLSRWVFLMKYNRWVHREPSIHRRPIPFSPKNPQFPYTTYRTLSIFMDIYFEQRGINAKQGNHACLGISHEIQSLDSQGTVYPPHTNPIFHEKLLVSLHNTSDLSLFMPIDA